MPVFVLLFTIFHNNSIAQKKKDNEKCPIPRDNSSNKFAYDGIVKVDSATKEELYKKAKQWVMNTLKPTDNITSFDDHNFEKIISTGNLTLEKRVPWCAIDNSNLNFIMTIHITNGEFSFRIENMVHTCEETCKNNNTVTPHSSSLEEIAFGNRLNNKIYEEVNHKIQNIIWNFKISMAANSLKK